MDACGTVFSKEGWLLTSVFAERNWHSEKARNFLKTIQSESYARNNTRSCCIWYLDYVPNLSWKIKGWQALWLSHVRRDLLPLPSCVSLNNCVIWSSDTQFPLSKRKKITQGCFWNQLRSRFYDFKHFWILLLKLLSHPSRFQKIGLFRCYSLFPIFSHFQIVTLLMLQGYLLTPYLRVFITSYHTCVSLKLDMNYLRTKTTLPIPWTPTTSNAL